MSAQDDRYERLKAIRDAVIHLTESPLYAYRTSNQYFPVIGQGSHTARVMFVGEAPGKDEAIYGRPFCGKSGKFLDELLASIELNRETVYITNIVKDRPPDNRDPDPAEIRLYAPFLDEQIAIIQPEIIATLGRFSMSYLQDKFGLAQQGISKVHGKVFAVETDYGEIKLVTLYHPAVALYDGGKRDTLLKDFRVIKSLLEGES